MNQKDIKKHVKHLKTMFPLDEEIITSIVVTYSTSANWENEVMDKLLELTSQKEEKKEKFDFNKFDKEFGFDIKKGDTDKKSIFSGLSGLMMRKNSYKNLED